MPPVDRNEPKRAEWSDSTYSLMEFMREFPDDATCLEWLWRERLSPTGQTAHCPRCEQERRFHRVKSRPSYSCDACGHHLHPTAGTIFHKSSTSLHLWFYAAYLITSTRCGISAKQLERELGVTYKTAWRMFNKIRNELMGDNGDGQLGGDVEIDETSVEGKPREHLPRREAMQLREHSRQTVIGMVERGGRVRLRVIPLAAGQAATGHRARSRPSSALVITDDWPAYNFVEREFLAHSRINHSAGYYVDGSTHTNTIEGSLGTSRRGCAAPTARIAALVAVLSRRVRLAQ
jgi:transposase